MASLAGIIFTSGMSAESAAVGVVDQECEEKNIRVSIVSIA
jgi:hypothetical protein